MQLVICGDVSNVSLILLNIFKECLEIYEDLGKVLIIISFPSENNKIKSKIIP